MVIVLTLVVILLLLAAAAALVVWLMPSVSEAVERVRIERRAAEASWRIHQRATAAFAEMLRAAREHQEPKR